MLILRRKKNESFLIGKNIRITVIECASDGVRIAIDAPKHISIIREELAEAEKVNQDALGPEAASLMPLHQILSVFPASSEKSDDATDKNQKEGETES